MSLATTTLAKAATNEDGEIYLTATTGVYLGTFLSIDVEILRVHGFGASTIVKVLRGVEGTAAVAHVVDSVVLIGTATDFSTAPVSAAIVGTTPDRTSSTIVQDALPTADNTSTVIGQVTS